MAKERPEDHLLNEEQFPRLNKTFYASEPADYFERRLHLLILQAGDWDGVANLLKKGLSVGSLSIRADDNPDDPDPERVGQHYTATEAEMLSHQTGEALLRLYFAHEFSGRSHPPCPRLDLARLRRSSDFRDRLESRFVKANMDNEANRRAVAKVFHLTEKRESFGPERPSEESWNSSLRLHELYLRHFARQYLNGAGLYNAAKHGLALTPQEEAGVELRGILERRGPAIHYLTVRTSPSQPIPRWSEVVHFVESDKLMTLTYRAITQIRMLWRVARHRYVNPSERGVAVGLLAGLSPEDIAFGRQPEHQGPMILTDLAVQLGYWKVANNQLGETDDAGATPMVGTPRERIEARIGSLVPEGWRLLDPEPFEGGWRVGVENVVDPNVTIGLWHEDLERAIGNLVAELRAHARGRPPEG